VEDRRKQAREIYDNFIMKELLSHSHVSTFVPVRRIFICLIHCVQDGCLEPASGTFLYKIYLQCAEGSNSVEQWFGDPPYTGVSVEPYGFLIC
jgi:hypothetical protein